MIIDNFSKSKDLLNKKDNPGLISLRNYTPRIESTEYYDKRFLLRYALQKKLHVAAILMITLISLAVFILPRINIFAATSPWNQTDWSGGVGSSTSNQYLSQTNMDTTVSGSFSLDNLNDQNWYNLSWQYRKKITFDNTNATMGITTENLVNFPVLIKLQNGVNIDYSKVKTGGADLRFTDSDGTTILAYDIDTWNASGNSYVWVKVPQIDANSNTDCIYMYYGNSGASAQTTPASTTVWSSLSSVYHLNETQDATAGGIPDAAGNNNQTGGNGFAAQLPTLTTDSVFGNAQSFDSSDDVDRSASTVVLGTQDVYMAGWFKMPGSLTGSLGEFMGVGNLNSNNDYLQIYVSGTSVYVGVNNSTGGSADTHRALVTSSSIAFGGWNYFVGVRSGTNLYGYFNGDLVGTYSSVPSNFALNSALRTAIGRYYSARPGLGAYVDEARFKIGGTAPTSAWIKADYKNQSNTFATYSSEGTFVTSGSLTSNIFDTGFTTNWGILTYTTNGVGTYSVKARSSSLSDLSDATAFGSCNEITSGSDISTNNCIHDNDRYIQYQVSITVGGILNPNFSDISIAFAQAETTPPTTNASNLSVTGINSGDWINIKPTISWDAGSDNVGGSGILGYCIAIDEANHNSPNNLDPEITAGILAGKDDGVTPTFCPFIVNSTSININSISGLSLTSGKEYYISLKAVDYAGNIFTSGTASDYQNLYSFRYDNTPPTNPSFLSLPGNFVSTKDITMTWPTGSGAASDSDSGLAGLQYRIGASGTWYGDLHTGSQDINDLLTNDGAYTTDATYDYPVIAEGSNTIYFRTWDNAGNTSSETLTASLKINTVAPSAPENLQVTPSDNTTNSYSFNWDAPGTFTGVASGITYCYTINTLPSLSSCNYTAAGVTSLSADAFANQPGTNTFYVVARDEANNINYDTYSSITFTYSGSAPGIPLSVEVSDISIKTNSDWRLVISWLEPSNVGAGISNYKVYRSNTNTTCSGNFGAFTQIGSTSGKVYSDIGLSQQEYYYCVKACDNANNCSASSSTVSETPTGKYTEPAVLLSEPVVSSTSTKKAVINWTTDRNSDSKIEFGLSTGQYFDAEIGVSTQVTAHTVTLDNLTAGTTYFFRAKWTDEDGNTGVSDEKSFKTSPPPELIEVRATNISIDSTFIRFTEEGGYKATILYGKTTSFGGSAELNTSPVKSTYTIPIKDLEDESKYYYTINLVDVEGTEYKGDTYSFETLPKPRISDVSIEEVKDEPSPTIRVVWTTNVDTSSILTYNPKGLESDSLQSVDIKLQTSHELKIAHLLPKTIYELTVRGVDNNGIEAVSNLFNFTTSTDSRAPLISNIQVEGLNTKTTSTNTDEKIAQLIISWDTDEPATSVVQFGEGSSGVYTQTSQVDLVLKQKHVVIINDLNSSTVYSLQINSKDEAGNQRNSQNFIAITPARNDNALDLILVNLRDIFGFLDF